MTTIPPEPAECPDTAVQRGNSWAQPIATRATDKAGNPIDWSRSTFTASSPELAAGTIALQVSGSPPTIVLSLTGAQTAAITVAYVHWYLAENVVMGGNKFVTGQIKVTVEQ